MRASKTGKGAVGAMNPALAGTGIFQDPKYKSTNTVQFRGQDKTTH